MASGGPDGDREWVSSAVSSHESFTYPLDYQGRNAMADLALFAQGAWLDASKLSNEQLLDRYTVNGFFPEEIPANGTSRK